MEKLNGMDVAYQGSIVKTRIRPKTTGFDIDNHVWSVEIRYGSYDKLYKKFERADFKVRENRLDSCNDYYVVVDTSGMSGVVKAIIRTETPDQECPEGIRKEVLKLQLYNVLLP